jgi:hypothetical protein
MHLSRVTTRAFRPAVVLGTCAALALTAVPAEAAPSGKKLKPVQGLSVTVDKPAYTIVADWDDRTGATAYRTTITSSLSGLQVTRESTLSEVTIRRSDLRSGEEVTVKVVAMKETRPRTSQPAFASASVPDLVAPTGEYRVQVTENTGDAKVLRASVTDDVTSPEAITQTISWGDGTSNTFTGAEFSHTYPEGPGVYYPTMTLVDGAGNAATFDLDPAVVRDTAVPTGEFALAAPSDVWATWTPVTLTEVMVDDDASDPANVTRSVDWGDGTVEPFTGTDMQHVYATAGTYNPVVTLTDEAGKHASATLDEAQVRVQADTTAPRATIKKPRRAKSVKAWRVLRGKVLDEGTGAKSAAVKVVEKRGNRWYAYRAATKRWIKVRTKRTALRRATGVATVVDGSWRLPVRGLRKGALVVKVKGKDNVGNTSRAAVRTQRLTRR